MNELRGFPEFKANWPAGKQASLSGCQLSSWYFKPGIVLECKISILTIQVISPSLDNVDPPAYINNIYLL